MFLLHFETNSKDTLIISRIDFCDVLTIFSHSLSYPLVYLHFQLGFLLFIPICCFSKYSKKDVTSPSKMGA